MNLATLSLVISVGLALIGVIADIFIRLAGTGPKAVDLKMIIIGALLYCSTVIGWFFVMKHLKFATIGVFYGISTLLFLVLIGVFYFKESLNIYEILGIIFAIASMILLGKFA